MVQEYLNFLYLQEGNGQIERLQLACFKSGYVRNQNSCYSNYQLNKQYKQNVKYTMLNEHNILVDKEYMMNSRALIHNGLTRLKYMLEFYLKNYTNTIL